MVKNHMASNTKTVRVHDIRYRQIPGFNTYGISSVGEVINLSTKQLLSPKDYDRLNHRFDLYRNGNRKTFTVMTLMRMTHSKAWCDSLEANCMTTV